MKKYSEVQVTLYKMKNVMRYTRLRLFWLIIFGIELPTYLTVLVFCSVWNQAFYRYCNFALDFEGLEEFLSKNEKTIKEFRDRNISTLKENDEKNG